MININLASDFPKVLFKYSKYHHYGKRILFNNELFASSPANFNDPFDVAMPFHYDPSTYTLERFTEKYLKKCEEIGRNIHKSKEDLMYEATDRYNMSKYNPSEYWNESKNTITEMDAKFYGIVSLSKEFKNILMWSHYTDSHKGYCLGFDTQLILETLCIDYQKFGFTFSPVTYVDKYPLLNFDDKNWKKNAVLRICSKNRCWSYENEYRIILKNNSDHSIIYPKEALKFIYLGCKMPENHKKEIIDYVNNNKLNTSIYQMEMSPLEFRLDFKEIKL